MMFRDSMTPLQRAVAEDAAANEPFAVAQPFIPVTLNEATMTIADLVTLGHVGLAAEESEKGCGLAASEHPDVILMDLEMPDDDRMLGHVLENEDFGINSVSQKAALSAHRKRMPRRAFLLPVPTP